MDWPRWKVPVNVRQYYTEQKSVFSQLRSHARAGWEVSASFWVRPRAFPTTAATTDLTADELSRGNRTTLSSELQTCTWMDATLKELASLVKEVYPEARKKGTHFNFAIVFTDVKRPGY